MNDDIPEVHHRALRDYRTALAMALAAHRTAASYSLRQVHARSGIPAETLRAYERGDALPQLVRLAHLGDLYGLTWADLLHEAAAHIYRAHGETAPDDRNDTHAQHAVDSLLFYCGVIPPQLPTLQLPPQQSRPFTDDSPERTR